MIQWIIKSIFFIIIFILVFSLWHFYSFIHPEKIVTHITPKSFGLDYESIEFKTTDDLKIKGWFIPNKNPYAKTILLLHGYPADKGDILASRLFLHEKYHLFFVDFRYLGESEGGYTTFGKKEVLDISAALNYLHTRGINEVGIWGVSLGAAVALLSLPTEQNVKALVAEAPFARLDLMIDDYYQIPIYNDIMRCLLRFWGRLFLKIDTRTINPIDSVKSIKIPVLMIYYKNDQVVPFEQALLMQQTVKDNRLIDFKIIDHAPHAAITENTKEEILKFFNEHL